MDREYFCRFCHNRTYLRYLILDPIIIPNRKLWFCGLPCATLYMKKIIIDNQIEQIHSTPILQRQLTEHKFRH